MHVSEKIKNNKHFQKLKPHLDKFYRLDRKLRIVLIALLILFLIGIPSVAYMSTKSNLEEIDARDIEQITAEEEPSEAPEETVEPTQSFTNTTPTKAPVATATKSPVPTSTPAPTSPPAQAKDTTPPTLDFLTGPADGSTIDFATFCFPMKASDNVTSSNDMQTRFKFDSDSYGEWGSNFSPCYYNVGNGSHTYSLEFRDQAGNVGSASRTFTVQVN